MSVVTQTEIGNAIIELRGALSLTQEAFATQARISRTSVAHFETGDRAPDPDSLVRLAGAALQIRREDLAEIFVRALPGVPEGFLKPAWNEFIDPNEYPRWMYHPTRSGVIVKSPREERALGPEWSRMPLQTR